MRPSAALVVETATMEKLLRGRPVELHDPTRRYRQGAIYAVCEQPPAITSCHVEVLSVERDDVLLQLATQDTPRMLARNPGAQRADYVSNPAKAMRDEPEPIDPSHVSAMTNAARQQRRAKIKEFRTRVLQEAEELTEGADRASSRRLRNWARVTSAL